MNGGLTINNPKLYCDFSVIPHIEILEDFIFSDLKKIKAVLISTY